MEIVIFWILCGFVGAALLSSHGKAGTGCLVGALLGPIGIILAWVEKNRLDRVQDIQRDNERTRELRALATSVVPGPAVDGGANREEQDCPWCAERILLRAKLCKHCGREVSAPVG